MGTTAAPVELNEEALVKKDLILRNLQEALGVDKLSKQLATEGKVPHVYWGTATTGKPHVGYLVPMQKIADFLNAGVKVTILFADLHAFLDNMKSTWELLENRVIYYENIIKALLQSLNVPIDRLHFVRGTTYQLSREYTFDLLRLCGQVSQRDALKAGAEVVKQVQSPLLSGLLYPLLQALDEQYLKVDGQFGGVDQRKIFILAEEQLPKLKLGKRWHLMNSMVPGLTGSKMSSSEENSKIDLLDDVELVKKKIYSAACPRQADDNGVLSFFNFVLIPISTPSAVVINNTDYFDFATIRDDFLAGKLSEEHLKECLANFISDLLTKVQTRANTDEVRQALEKGYCAVPDVDSEKSEQDVDCDKEVLDKFVGRSKTVGSLTSLKSAISAGKKVSVLFPIHPKGKFHLGFISGLLKIKELYALGLNVEATLLISDIEAFLDEEKVSWTAKEARSEYFKVMATSLIKAMGLADKVNVVLASSLEDQFSSDFVLDMYKMACAVTRDEITLPESGPSLAGTLVPIMHALNVRSSQPDVVILGEDSTQLGLLAEKLWKSVKSPVVSQLTVPVIPGCDGNKMACRTPDFLLDPLDTPKQTKTKIARSFCEPQNLEGNVAMKLAELVVYPLLDGKAIAVNRSADNGGDLSVPDYAALEQEFTVGSNPSFPLHPGDLKNAVVTVINQLFDQVRADLAPVQTKLLAAAFPTNKGGKKKN